MDEVAVICIGRNIKGGPMDRLRWREFIGEVCTAVQNCRAEVHNTAEGTGYWNGETEDTFVITFSGGDLDQLARDLPLVAFLFEQEAIALIRGAASLVSAL